MSGPPKVEPVEYWLLDVEVTRSRPVVEPNTGPVPRLTVRQLFVDDTAGGQFQDSQVLRSRGPTSRERRTVQVKKNTNLSLKGRSLLSRVDLDRGPEGTTDKGEGRPMKTGTGSRKLSPEVHGSG